MKISLTVNGRLRELDIDPHETLLDVLRERLDLTGTKKGCGEGECGACTVILDGRCVNSCLILAAEADGSDILTIEGLARDGKPSVLQQAFVDTGAVQCGFCIPGMIMAAHQLLAVNPQPSREQIEEGLEGNLCRCGGYARIVEAVRASSRVQGSGLRVQEAAGRQYAGSVDGAHGHDSGFRVQKAAMSPSPEQGHFPVDGSASGSPSNPEPRTLNPASNPEPPTLNPACSVIGQSLSRAGGLQRVTGAQKYVADFRVPGMLHAAMVWLNCGHARILSIDRAQALKVDGVKAVFTADDIPAPMPRFGPMYADRPLLAVGQTRFHGEPVALVVAESRHAAEEAARLVKVQYEELPAITSIAEALAPGAELVQDPSIRQPGPFQHTNILGEWRYGWGDVQACGQGSGFRVEGPELGSAPGTEPRTLNPEPSALADLVIENTYRFPIVTHFAIEPFAYIAEPVDDGITVYSATQNPFPLQRTIATVLDLPIAKVRVIAPDPGGAFGGKQHPKLEPMLAYFARRLGRPIRLELTLAESFQAVRRAAAEVRVRSGFRRDGTIVFQDIESNYLVGAYADIAARVISKAGYIAAGPYKVPNVRIVARGVFSHTTPSTAFRGFGAPQENWAVESQMDAAAKALGIDRVAIRLKNLPKRGEQFIPNELPADGDWAEVLKKAAQAIGWEEYSGFRVQSSVSGSPLNAEPRTQSPSRRGRGIAMGIKMGPTTASSYAIVRLHADASVTVFTGTSDMGQGARTVFIQIVADQLGVPPEKVNVVMGDTSVVPYDFQTSASRSTVCMGNAIVDACRQIRRQLREMADEGSGFRVQGSGQEALNAGPPTLDPEPLLLHRFGKLAGELIAVGRTRSEPVQGHPMGGVPAFYEVVAFAAELSVDTETGEMDISKVIVAGDVGKALNPQHVAMQDEGAAVMGLGHSMMEQIILDKAGRIRNLGALDYRIPTVKDMPRQLTSLHIENADGPGPWGAKGCAEGGILATAPAISAAVEEAIGIRIRELPLTPERIWRALNDARPNQDR